MRRRNCTSRVSQPTNASLRSVSLNMLENNKLTIQFNSIRFEFVSTRNPTIIIVSTIDRHVFPDFRYRVHYHITMIQLQRKESSYLASTNSPLKRISHPFESIQSSKKSGGSKRDDDIEAPRSDWNKGRIAAATRAQFVQHCKQPAGEVTGRE